MIAYLISGKIVQMADPTEEEIKTFVAHQIGLLQADLAKLISVLNLLVQPERVRRYRWLTYLILVWLMLLTALLIGHALYTAGLVGR